jgi:hypothetical protein
MTFSRGSMQNQSGGKLKKKKIMSNRMELPCIHHLERKKRLRQIN